MRRPPSRPVLFPVEIVGPEPLAGWIASRPRGTGGDLTWCYAFSMFPGRLRSKRTPSGRDGFRALELRLTADGGVTIVRECAFRFLWKAKDRAWRWYCGRVERPFSSWHKRPRMSKAEKLRRAARLGIG